MVPVHLARTGDVWHYLPMASKARTAYCGLAFAGRPDWWRFGDWGEREICGSCVDAVADDRVVVVAVGS